MPRVAVVDDHAIVTSGVVAVLSGERLQVDEYSTVNEQITPDRYEAVLLDLHLGGAHHLQGSPAVEYLVRLGLRVVVMSGGAEQVDICDCIGRGALAYVSKDRVESFGRAVASATNGTRLLSGPLAGALLADLARRPLPITMAERELGDFERRFLEEAFHGDGSDTATSKLRLHRADADEVLRRIWTTAALRSDVYQLHLTDRQIELIELLAKLDSRDHVAHRLGITLATFQRHVANIKMNYVNAYPTAHNLTPQEVVALLSRRTHSLRRAGRNSLP